MTKNEWHNELGKYLITLSPNELAKANEYYDEIYSDKLDSGLSEKEIIHSFGNPRDAAQKILFGDGNPYIDNINSSQSSSNAKSIYNETVEKDQPIQPKINKSSQSTTTHNDTSNSNNPKTKLPVWAIVCLIVASPFLIGLAGTIFGVVVTVVITIFAMWIAMWAVLFSLIIASGAMILAGLAAGVLSIYPLILTPSIGLVQIGLCMVIIGLGILLILVSNYMWKLSFKVNKWFFKWLFRIGNKSKSLGKSTKDKIIRKVS